MRRSSRVSFFSRAAAQACRSLLSHSHSRVRKRARPRGSSCGGGRPAPPVVMRAAVFLKHPPAMGSDYRTCVHQSCYTGYCQLSKSRLYSTSASGRDKVGWRTHHFLWRLPTVVCGPAHCCSAPCTASTTCNFKLSASARSPKPACAKRKGMVYSKPCCRPYIYAEVVSGSLSLSNR